MTPTDTAVAEKRRHHRFQLVTPIVVNLNQTLLPGTLVDISMGGLLMEVENATFICADLESSIANGTPIMVDVPSLSLRGLRATVLRTGESSRGKIFAVQFEEPRVEIAQKIIKRAVS